MSDLIRSYRDLDVWKKGLTLVKNIYQDTANYAPEEKFGLVNQMRRAAVSIPSNIAEGQARSTTGQFQHFIYIALGSIAELETQILISAELKYLKAQESQNLLTQLDEIGKMLRGLDKALKNRKSSAST